MSSPPPSALRIGAWNPSIYTDIGRDGMLSGINIEATVKLSQAVRIPIIASGGLAGMADIEALCAVQDEGIEGVICGRAIYSGDLDFAAAQERADALTESTKAEEPSAPQRPAMPGRCALRNEKKIGHDLSRCGIQAPGLRGILPRKVSLFYFFKVIAHACQTHHSLPGRDRWSRGQRGQFR